MTIRSLHNDMVIDSLDSCKVKHTPYSKTIIAFAFTIEGTKIPLQSQQKQILRYAILPCTPDPISSGIGIAEQSGLDNGEQMWNYGCYPNSQCRCTMYRDRVQYPARELKEGTVGPGIRQALV
jgi:hypothetical protein